MKASKKSDVHWGGDKQYDYAPPPPLQDYILAAPVLLVPWLFVPPV